MTNLVKLKILFAFYSFLISTVKVAKAFDNIEASEMLEYYKVLEKSGFMLKTERAKYIASVKRVDVETSYAENHVCTAAVISSSSVLLAAECTYDKKRPFEPNELIVVVGMQYGSWYDQFAQTMYLRTIRRHDRYTPGSDAHNIAILFLNDTIVSIGETVQITPIAKEPPRNYETCKAVGFGVIYYQDNKMSQILEGTLKIWPKTLCQSYLKRHGKDENLGSCAGDFRGMNPPPCKMIASEPLYCNDVLYGISIFNIGCEGFQGFASVYINLWEYNDWISQHAEFLHEKAACLDCDKCILLMAFCFSMLRKF